MVAWSARFMSVLTFLLSINFGYAQQKSFNGLLVDTIEITSSSGHYHFDDAGTTTGTRDSYIIVFNKEQNKYFTEYKRTQIKLTIHPETEVNKQSKIHSGAFDNQRALDDLFIDLSIRYKKISIDQLGYDEQKIIAIISNKRILKIAKVYKVVVKPIFNFDINKHLAEILPSNFYRIKTIGADAIINNYIVWYLKRREIIWDYN